MLKKLLTVAATVALAAGMTVLSATAADAVDSRAAADVAHHATVAEHPDHDIAGPTAAQNQQRGLQNRVDGGATRTADGGVPIALVAGGAAAIVTSLALLAAPLFMRRRTS